MDCLFTTSHMDFVLVCQIDTELCVLIINIKLRNSNKIFLDNNNHAKVVCCVLSFSVPLPVMPRYCCVPMCKSAVGGHLFPADRTLRQQWIVAIGRVDSSSQHKLWTPSPHSVVCHKHFKESDYQETLLGWT